MFQWVILGQFCTRCKENQATFQGLLVIKQKTAKTDVGSGSKKLDLGMMNQAMMEIKGKTKD